MASYDKIKKKKASINAEESYKGKNGLEVFYEKFKQGESFLLEKNNKTVKLKDTADNETILRDLLSTSQYVYSMAYLKELDVENGENVAVSDFSLEDPAFKPLKNSKKTSNIDKVSAKSPQYHETLQCYFCAAINSEGIRTYKHFTQKVLNKYSSKVVSDVSLEDAYSKTEEKWKYGSWLIAKKMKQKNMLGGWDTQFHHSSSEYIEKIIGSYSDIKKEIKEITGYSFASSMQRDRFSPADIWIVKNPKSIMQSNSNDSLFDVIHKMKLHMKNKNLIGVSLKEAVKNLPKKGENSQVSIELYNADSSDTSFRPISVNSYLNKEISNITLLKSNNPIKNNSFKISYNVSNEKYDFQIDEHRGKLSQKGKLGQSGSTSVNSIIEILSKNVVGLDKIDKKIDGIDVSITNNVVILLSQINKVVGNNSIVNEKEVSDSIKKINNKTIIKNRIKNYMIVNMLRRYPKALFTVHKIAASSMPWSAPYVKIGGIG